MERTGVQFTWIGGNAGLACLRGLAMPIGGPTVLSEP